jgi:hypothetical protein
VRRAWATSRRGRSLRSAGDPMDGMDLMDAMDPEGEALHLMPEADGGRPCPSPPLLFSSSPPLS